ncbi:F-box/FBD/LRR-repeat protein At4g26340 [Sorghum bicolor]|uniref:F-box/FBD/LRR-repeat protein At4g26340 n=1 Tax=Sorghum bicolor TaxID=4558 RepID=UPI000B4236EC|nr:F-box/FBD/LRR-repeat protein At4g26340 [Sorghum bicolor]|eukprot:XP_021317838.1 F-box/FBD/LRR-repeat protein At4g26340 [Sorghum bicolor]
MADGEPDRLSQLPDEVLQHILQLAPCREAESTAVLSRRWRGLWPPATSAVKFDIPSTDSDKFHRRRRDASLRGAKEALAAAQGPVKRLSVHVGERLRTSAGEGCRFVDIVVGDVLSYRASRGVQDVRVIGADVSSSEARGAGDSWCSLADHRVGEFEFSTGSVASAALRLRVLHITNCSDLTPPPRASTFPCLEVLRLRKCSVHLQSLQDMVVASPQLAVLQLEYVFLSSLNRGSQQSHDRSSMAGE